MKKIFAIISIAIFSLCLGVAKSNAQVLLGLPYDKIHSDNKRPVSYQFEREADIMWAKVVWRRIELSERANQHLFFTTTPTDGRVSLIDCLLEGIHTQGLTAYNENTGNEFASIATEKEVHSAMGSTTVRRQIQDLESEELRDTLIEEPYVSSDIKAYLLKEIWFYDKQRSVIDVKIIGLCPIRTYYREDDAEKENPIQKKTFWVYYPEARKILSQTECFNSLNDGQRLSYEEIFEKRMFSSFIIQESNMYDNRLIQEYARGHEALLEAENVKNTIFNYEQDNWEE